MNKMVPRHVFLIFLLALPFLITVRGQDTETPVTQGTTETTEIALTQGATEAPQTAVAQGTTGTETPVTQGTTEATEIAMTQGATEATPTAVTEGTTQTLETAETITNIDTIEITSDGQEIIDTVNNQTNVSSVNGPQETLESTVIFPQSTQTQGGSSEGQESSVTSPTTPQSEETENPTSRTEIPKNERKWALIVAGSKGWDKYYNQANACHAYKLLRAHGIDENNIITMMYDDIAWNSQYEVLSQPMQKKMSGISNYKQLIEQSGLYTQDFIKQFGINDPNWDRDTWMKRELYLRHNMVCYLLANLTPSDESSAAEATSSTGEKSKIRITQLEDGTIKVQKIHKPLFEDGGKRYICLESSSVAGFYQQTLSESFQMSKPPIGKWDLVDQGLQRFIEVKVSRDIPRCKTAFALKTEFDVEHYSLVIINPDTCMWTLVNCEKTDFTGMEKVVDFLVKRSQVIQSSHILVSEHLDDENLHESVFVSVQFNAHVDSWLSQWWDPKAPSMSQKKYDQGKGPNFRGVTPLDFLKHLEDPSSRDPKLGYVQWKGKILPETWLCRIQSDKYTDKEMCSEFAEHILASREWGKDSVQGKYVLGENSMKELLNFIKEGENNKDVPIKLKDLLGVGAKGMRYNAANQNTKIPEKTPHSKKVYHPWFHSLVTDLTKCPPDPDLLCFPDLLRQAPSSAHSLQNFLNYSSAKIAKIFATSSCGFMLSRITNIYSRLGGIYSMKNAGKGGGFNEIVWMPIYSSCYNYHETQEETWIIEKEPIRMVSGVLVRGPDHSRCGSDKIQILTIELVKNDDRTKEYLKFVKCLTVFPVEDSLVVVRQNSVMKMDSSYLTFCQSIVFLISNNVGEIFFNTAVSEVESDIFRIGDTFLNNHKSWVLERIVENTLMCMTGSSQEEGMFGGVRMLFMTLLELSRGRPCFMADVPDFCDKINECIIDRPLAMYWVKSIIDVIKLMIPHGLVQQPTLDT